MEETVEVRLSLTQTQIQEILALASFALKQAPILEHTGIAALKKALNDVVKPPL